MCVGGCIPRQCAEASQLCADDHIRRETTVVLYSLSESKHVHCKSLLIHEIDNSEMNHAISHYCNKAFSIHL